MSSHLLVIGNAEDDIEHALLHLGQLEQAREHNGTHVGHGDAHRDSSAVVHIPQTRGAPLELPVLDTELLDALRDVLGVVTRLRRCRLRRPSRRP